MKDKTNIKQRIHMKKIRVVGIFAVVAVSAAMMTAIVVSSKASATTSLCHSTSLSIKAPTKAVAGKTIKVSGSLGKTPQHTVKAALQTRLSTATKWAKKGSANLSGARYSIKWKTPAKKGTYKVRVLISHLTASKASAVRTVVVK